MNNEYKILWIDDQHETLGGFKGSARRHGIHLSCYKSLDGGLSELERNFTAYDGVLLDAKFFEFEDDKPQSEDTFHVHRAKDRIQKLPKKFEIFVLTGQAKVFNDQSFRQAFLRVYEKGSLDVEERLFNDLIQAAKNQPDTQLRQKYHRVFEVCTERYIGEKARQDLLNLLKNDNDEGTENHFNAIRKIVEDLFLTFNKFNLLPVDFVSPNVALNPSSLFLSGKEQSERTDDRFKKYRHGEETHLPQVIAYQINFILNIVQPAVHRSEVDEHVRFNQSPYLLKSVLFLLMDILVWFKTYVDSKPKTENWTSTVDDIEKERNWQRGAVINYNYDKGFAFFCPDEKGENIFIPPHLVTDFKLIEGTAINVVAEDYVDSRTDETKTRVKQIELIKE